MDDPHAETPAPPRPVIGRLTKRAEFLACAKGKAVGRGSIFIQILPGPAPEAMRVGFTATKKIGNAVIRNRCKRRMRELARALLPLHGKAGHDYVFVARTGLPERAWERLLDDTKNALISLGAGEGQDGSERRPPRPAKTASAKPSPTPPPNNPPGAPPAPRTAR